jgi:hypothetical protein
MILALSMRFRLCHPIGEFAHFMQSLSELSDSFESSVGRRFGATSVKAQKLASRRKMWGATIKDPTIFAGVVLQAVAHGEGFLAFERGNVVLNAPFQIVRMHTFRPAIAKFLLQGSASEIQPCPVEIKTSHVGARHPDHDWRAIRELLEVLDVSFGAPFQWLGHDQRFYIS